MFAKPRTIYVGPAGLDFYAYLWACLAGGVHGGFISNSLETSSWLDTIDALKPDLIIFDVGSVRQSGDVAVVSSPDCSASGDLELLSTGSLFTMTSGTLGSPKVAEVDLSALHDFVEWVSDEFCISEEDRWLEASNPTADLALTNAIIAHSAGACLVLPSRSEALSLSQLCIDERVTSMRMVPVVGQMLLLDSIRRKTRLPWLRFLGFGGDRLPSDLPAKISAATGAAPQVVATYGLAEAAGFLLYRRLDITSNRPTGESVVLDRSAPGCQPSIVAAEERSGDLGRLSVFTAAAALSVVRRRPDGSLETISQKIKSRQRVAILTDDVARSTAGGIEIIGRSDRSVKWRGTLVNLAEIEMKAGTILSCDCYVSYRAGELLLAVERCSLTIREVRQLLLRRLPAGLTISKIELVEELPRNGTGKLNIARCEDLLE